jgi:hypothetical protein
MDWNWRFKTGDIFVAGAGTCFVTYVLTEASLV